MIHLCIFGGYEGPLPQDKRLFLTIFGGCELRRPTLARQLIAARKNRPEKAASAKVMVVTVCGSTEITQPTLTEEYLDMREAVRSGALDLRQWDGHMAELERWQSASFMSLTLMAGFDEAKLPEETAEVEALALQRHLGNVSESAGRILELGVGQNGAQRRAIVQQAVMAG